MCPRRVAVLAIALVTAFFALAGTAAANHEGSILVKVKPHTDVRSLAKRHGMAVSRYLPDIHWVELTPREQSGGASISTASLADRVEADSAVKSVDAADEGEKVEWDFVPRDPVFHPNEIYEDGTQVGWHFIKPNFPIAWDQSQGFGVTVAVIDSEFDTNNPDLRDKLVYRFNADNGTAAYHTENVQAQPGDVFHGSHTSGLVGARTDNNEGVAGACFECKVMAIKIGSEASGTFVDASFLGDVAEGINYATDHGASVISLSLGGPRPHQPLLDAVNYAASKGVVIVASAGNTQETNPGVPQYPAAYPNVIGVGATDSKDEIASFSSQGPYVDLVAPGVNVLSTVNAADPAQDPGFGDKVAVGVKSGTSMSAPLVAGLAALMRSARPDLTPAEIEGLMKSTARDLGIAGPDPVYGAGRIEAGTALAAARAYVRPTPPASPAPPPPPPVMKKHKRFKRIPAFIQLSVTQQKGKLVYSGKLATKPRCRQKRKVVLLEKGAFKPLAAAKTNPRGVFHFVLGKHPRQKVRAKVKARKFGATICKSGRSPFVRAH
jgi:subtilisin family serine protease